MLLGLGPVNLSAIQRRHASGGMPHLLPDDGRVDPGQFPSPVATPSKCVQTALRQAGMP
jgi:hypothetical protein